jgi:hypothetical protein
MSELETGRPPSPQELLRRLVGDAEPVALREELIAALRAGATVHPWVVCAASRAGENARLHEALEGAAEARAALAAAGASVGVAEVVTGGRRLVAIMPGGHRAAIVRRPVERRAGPEPAGWSFAGAREPAEFGAVRSADGVEHAGRGDGTLCGVPSKRVVPYRHHFRPGTAESCPRCTEAVAAAPSEPGEQERLHGLIADADPSPMRDELAAALERGAEITLWIEGTGPGLAQHYGRLDGLTEGREPVAAALADGARVGLAHVLHGDWRCTIVLRDGEPPLLGRGPTG